MFRNVLIETASTRAHSAILNALEVEVITRRDTAVTVYDKANLRMFVVARQAFADSWNTLMPNVDSISYAIAWDNHFEKSKRKRNVMDTVNEYMQMILEDIAKELESLFPIENIEDIAGAEKALSEITGADKSENLLAFI